MLPLVDLPTTRASHPPRRVWLGTRSYWLCQLTGWGYFFATTLLPVPFATSGPEASWSAAISSATAIACSGILLTHLLRLLLLRLLVRPVSGGRLLLVIAAAALLLGAIQAFVQMKAIEFFVNAWAAPKTPLTWNFLDYLETLVISGPTIALWSLLYLGIRLDRQHRRLRMAQLELESSLRGAELNALKQQLNPHFLFNSLNSIRAMIPLEQPDARRMVSMLADLLRRTLAFGERQTVRLDQELELAELYLGIEKMRHAERLRWSVRTCPEVLGRPCPPFFVQTLVENAMKHGIDRREEGGAVEIVAENRRGGTLLQVRNPGALGTAPSQPGGRGGRYRTGQSEGAISFSLRSRLHHPASGGAARHRAGRGLVALCFGGGTMRALIVDDEALARSELRKLLLSHPAVEVAGEAANGTEAMRRVRELRPDLLFLDIQMPGMNGFELLGKLATPGLEVIFVTAYDRFALQAFEVNAVDYLLKPVDRVRLGKALERVAARRGGGGGEEPPPKPLSEGDQIFLRDGERCWFVPVRSIRMLEACGNYTRVVTGESSPLVGRPLSALEARLPPGLFLRANRSQLVNLNEVEATAMTVSGGLLVRLRGGLEVEVSRRQAQSLRERMSL